MIFYQSLAHTLTYGFFSFPYSFHTLIHSPLSPDIYMTQRVTKVKNDVLCFLTAYHHIHNYLYLCYKKYLTLALVYFPNYKIFLKFGLQWDYFRSVSYHPLRSILHTWPLTCFKHIENHFCLMWSRQNKVIWPCNNVIFVIWWFSKNNIHSHFFCQGTTWFQAQKISVKICFKKQ